MIYLSWANSVYLGWLLWSLLKFLLFSFNLWMFSSLKVLERGDWKLPWTTELGDLEIVGIFRFLEYCRGNFDKRRWGGWLRDGWAHERLAWAGELWSFREEDLPRFFGGEAEVILRIWGERLGLWEGSLSVILWIGLMCDLWGVCICGCWFLSLLIWFLEFFLEILWNFRIL